MEGSGFGSVQINYVSGCGPWRLKKPTDPDADPDSEHFFKLFILAFRKYFFHTPFLPEFFKHTC
jgi:hypothetical protein